MSLQLRLLIFGLARGTSRQSLHDLVQPCADSRVAVFDVPGDNDQAFAVVRLGGDERLASRLADRIRTRRFHGRRLQPWLSVLPWA